MKLVANYDMTTYYDVVKHIHAHHPEFFFTDIHIDVFKQQLTRLKYAIYFFSFSVFVFIFFLSAFTVTSLIYLDNAANVEKIKETRLGPLLLLLVILLVALFFLVVPIPFIYQNQLKSLDNTIVSFSRFTPNNKRSE